VFNNSANTIQWQIGGDYQADVVRQSENVRKKPVVPKNRGRLLKE
jgi:hypothetical protein